MCSSLAILKCFWSLAQVCSSGGSEDTRFLHDDESLADSEGFRDRVIAIEGETATFADALPERFHGIFRVPLSIQRGGILVQMIGRDPAVRVAQVRQELQGGHLAVAPQWIIEFIDEKASSTAARS